MLYSVVIFKEIRLYKNSPYILKVVIISSVGKIYKIGSKSINNDKTYAKSHIIFVIR